MYTDEILHDPEVQAVMEKVDFCADPDLDESEAVTNVRVELRTQDGREFSKTLSRWKGDPGNPATKQEIQEKFLRITKKVLSQKEAEQVIEVVENLESLENMKELGTLIRCR